MPLYICIMNSTISTQNLRGNLFVRNLLTFFTHPQARAVGLVFSSESILMASWGAHIPYVKQQLHLSDAQLGMTLFALPVGLLMMNPLTGWLVAKLGEARACLWSAVLLCLSILIPISATHPLVLCFGLFLLGLGAALINVAMNTCATNIERTEGIVIMSSCHGMWSLGGMVSAGLAGIAIAQHIPPFVHIATVAALVLLMTFLVQPILAGIPSSNLASEGDKAVSSFVRPNRDLMLMILIGLAIALGEGAAFDWSAVYLRETLGASSQIAPLGFACFSLTMTAGRFLGDAIIPKIGAKRWLQVGATIGTVGLLVAILIPHPPTALLGFALLGVGCSLGAPILYSASLRIPGIPPAAGLATFATFSFVGFLAGPPIIGFVAEAFGLALGLAFVAGVLLISALLARLVNLF